ncbi:isoleucyl-tRNA synthetase [Sistotremastrum niveocremeum HHB9708]|uniref:Isoleucine--tRNA ligase, mitochondrial n=1 Tax=Sistotremastrum niveocremeum HHB9708 TaxID=1314777 RepID=A0A164YQM6_9AGAM|nr:isoleucyl-tRNA synthetase [Sistotremastrum niveocremeum HHB9708]
MLATLGSKKTCLPPRCIWRSFFSASCRRTDANKAYSKTLLLPKTTFPLRTEGDNREAPYRQKASDDLYRWQSKNLKKQPFIFHDGPPYANGSIHIGHALNKILKDIINRYNVLQGRPVHYMPGWDCHGLPIEMKALQELKATHKTVSPVEIRSAARKVANREIERQRNEFRQLGIMADWSDEGTYRTLDHQYEIRQLGVFKKMVEKGLIYRRYRPVHWSPSSESALAEAELSYKEDHKSRSVYVAFQVPLEALGPSLSRHMLNSSKRSLELLVWTTTPWTLPANMSILVNSELTYSLVASGERCFIIAKDRLEALKGILVPSEILCLDLVGQSYTPLFGHLSKESRHAFKISAASFVTSLSGTGLVHSAPAHGFDDYLAFVQTGRHLHEQIISPVQGNGMYLPEIADLVPGEDGQRLIGKFVLGEGNDLIISVLGKEGRLLAEEIITHKYPYDWKTKEPIIVRATQQWFANIDSIKDDAHDALASVSFYPANGHTRLESYVQERSEWCISRQRSWGLPIPILYETGSNDPVMSSESLNHIISILSEKGVSYWWDGEVENFLHASLRDNGKTYRKGTDTLDVWFDSGTSWTLLKDPAVNPQGKRDTDALSNVVLEGSDQHRGWFQSLLLTAVGASPPGRYQRPYDAVITHGFVLDEEGKKMSKSVGNVISPLEVIHGGPDKKKEPAYGADVLRLWAASVEYWHDVNVGHTALAHVAESLRKIRNSCRFILGNLASAAQVQDVPADDVQLSLADRYVMHQLYLLEKTALESYALYNFPRVVNSLSHFANITLSSFYFDIMKDSLYADAINSAQRRATVFVLRQVLSTMTHVLAPILPHLAEEIHESRNVHSPSDLSFFSQEWKPMDYRWNDDIAQRDMQGLLEIRGEVLALLETARRDKRIKSSLEAEVHIIIPDTMQDDLSITLRRNESLLKTLFIVSDAVIHTGGLVDQHSAWSYSQATQMKDSSGAALECHIRPAKGLKCPRCWTYTRASDEDLCQRCDSVINS